MEPLHVIIIGAGPAGLLIAQGLKTRGISHSIFEKAPGERSRDWGVTVSWGRETILKLLPKELGSRIDEANVNPYSTPEEELEQVFYRNGSTGEKLMTFSLPGSREMSMKKMKRLFCQGVPVQYGKTLSTIECSRGSGKVTARFADGTQEIGTILVGADGNGSVTRRTIVHDKDTAETETLDYAMMNFAASYPADQALKLKSQFNVPFDLGIHPKGMYIRGNLLDVPDPDKPETWLFQYLCTWPLTSKDQQLKTSHDRVQRIKELTEDYADPHRAGIQWIPDDTEIGPDSLKVWRPRKWNNNGGLTTLAGDAAHASTFHRGQGVNNAIKDAWEFVAAMERLQLQGMAALADIIDTYDAEVIERGTLEVDISNQQTRMTHVWEELMQSPVMKYGGGPSNAK